MQKIDNIGICLDVEDIKAMNVSINTAEKWIKIKNPADKRRDLYPYKDLKPKYQALCKMFICGGMEIGEYYLKSQIVNWLPYLPEADRKAIENYRIQKEENDYKTGEIVSKDKEGLSTEDKTKYMIQARWILLMRDGYERFKKQLKSLDIINVDQFRNLCLQVANKNGADFRCSNMVAFKRDKINRYSKEGIVGIISGRHGNTNTLKVDDEKLQTLINLYAVRTKPSTKKVHKAYLTIAQTKGWDEVTEQTVFNHLHKPEVKQAWTLGRHGVDIWKRDYEYTNHRFRATMPNAIWVGDDTKVNLYYLDDNKLKASLQVYAIIDSHSGYWLGRSYAESRKGLSITADNVRDAFGDSVEKSGGYMPFQMQYDNDGANNFYERLNTLHFPCMPYNGQSKYIERSFKKLQENFMADDEAFTGMNIQSKTDNSKRIGGESTPYANKEEAIKAQEFWFEVSNNTKGADGLTPKEKYYGTKNPDAQRMLEEDALNILFEWNKHTITFRKDGLTMIHNKRPLIYTVRKNGNIDNEFYEQHIGREFKVKYNPRNMSKIALYTIDERFMAMAEDKIRIAEAVQDYTAETGKQIAEGLQMKKLQQANIREKLQIANDVSEADTILGTGYRYVDKHTQNQAEADMYTNHKEQIEEEDKYIDLEAERRARARRQ